MDSGGLSTRSWSEPRCRISPVRSCWTGRTAPTTTTASGTMRPASWSGTTGPGDRLSVRTAQQRGARLRAGRERVVDAEQAGLDVRDLLERPDARGAVAIE